MIYIASYIGFVICVRTNSGNRILELFNYNLFSLEIVQIVKEVNFLCDSNPIRRNLT